ncbi:hypothetical protein NDU88_007511 [Pleurodeles waltl]|uniref:Uncharacterized protein n=1 Tax=Pleurodeles waltl TaxID=8319 RepID=A0AAV7U2I0_PLEWA|nr:hypothetical protein NDU88_007511 [Pleurodeles waltl]
MMLRLSLSVSRAKTQQNTCHPQGQLLCYSELLLGDEVLCPAVLRRPSDQTHPGSSVNADIGAPAANPVLNPEEGGVFKPLTSTPKGSNGFPRDRQRNEEEATAERRGGEDDRDQQQNGEEETTRKNPDEGDSSTTTLTMPGGTDRRRRGEQTGHA